MIVYFFQELAQIRGAKLAESNQLHEFFRELDDEDSWIKEKKILVTSEDFGKDLTGVQNLRKKHKRFEQELAAKEQAIQVCTMSLQHKIFTSLRKQIANHIQIPRAL